MDIHKFWSIARKATTAAAFVGVSAVAAHLVPSPWDTWLEIIIAAGAYVGVYAMPNAKQEPPTAS
jgi:hypothetical protein